jgi:hypothetical protein
MRVKIMGANPHPIVRVCPHYFLNLVTNVLVLIGKIAYDTEPK